MNNGLWVIVVVAVIVGVFLLLFGFFVLVAMLGILKSDFDRRIEREKAAVTQVQESIDEADTPDSKEG